MNARSLEPGEPTPTNNRLRSFPVQPVGPKRDPLIDANSQAIARSCREVQGSFAWFEAHADEIAWWVAAYAESGVSGVSYGGSRPAPGHSDPTVARAMRQMSAAHDQWLPLFRQVKRDISKLRRLVLGFETLPAEVVQQALLAAKREPGSGECSVCGRFCPGRVTLADGTKIDDRLKSAAGRARCDTCRIYFERNGTERPLDCGHGCCAERANPRHEHFLDPADCPSCLRLEAEAS